MITFEYSISFARSDGLQLRLSRLPCGGGGGSREMSFTSKRRCLQLPSDGTCLAGPWLNSDCVKPTEHPVLTGYGVNTWSLHGHIRAFALKTTDEHHSPKIRDVISSPSKRGMF